MSAARFFTDEDIYGAVAVALCRAGYDAVSTPAVDRLEASDESHLEWAAAEGRVLVTFNVAHFARLHSEWMQQGRHHAGIIVANQCALRDMLRRLLHLAGTLDADAMLDRLEFLGDW